MAGRVIITGASGYIGRALTRRLGAERVIPLYNRTPIAGGIRFDALNQRLEDVMERPDGATHCVILHADSSPNSVAAVGEQAERLNQDSCIQVVDSCRAWGLVPVFASSEAAYGQDLPIPYDETVEPIPCYAYGRCKVAVERHIAQAGIPALTVRIARVCGDAADDPSGFEGWIEAVKTNGVIRCAADQMLNPACLTDAVEGLARLIDGDFLGVYHLPGERQIPRIELLELFLAEVRRHRPVEVRIERCSLHDFPVKERRPLNSALDGRKIWRETGFSPTPHAEVCRRVAQSFAPAGAA